MKQNYHVSSRLKLVASGLSLVVAAVASAQTLQAISIVGANNSGYIGAFDQAWTNGTTANASVNRTFTGLDMSRTQQTMGFSAQTITSAQYGQLHSYTTGSVTNSYYNPVNPDVTDYNGSTIFPGGSPKVLDSLGFAIFTDTLQFGGSLQAGYQARYVFHIDGTNSGPYASADLGVDVTGQGGDAWFNFKNGYYSNTWATKSFAINGVTPQDIRVQFSDQVVFNLNDLPEGGSYTGTSDFSSTATLTGIRIVDANGRDVSGVTVSSASGTQYNVVHGVPAPGCVPMVIGMVGAMVRRMRRQSK